VNEQKLHFRDPSILESLGKLGKRRNCPVKGRQVPRRYSASEQTGAPFRMLLLSLMQSDTKYSLGPQTNLSMYILNGPEIASLI